MTNLSEQTVFIKSTASIDITEPAAGTEIAGMAMAGASMTVLQVMISVFIAYYYTNIAGIGAAAVGTLLLVAKIAEAFSDLGMAAAIPGTKSRWGQARPWGLRLALPLFVSVALVFWVPENWGGAAKTAYACVTYLLMTSAAIAPAGIAGAVLGTNVTVNQKSRQKMAVLFSMLTMAGSVFSNIAVLKITQSLGDGYYAWRIVAVIFGAFALVGQLAQFLLTRERIAATRQAPSSAAPNEPRQTRDSGSDGATSPAPEPASTNASIKFQLPALLKNKYFIIMCAVGALTALDGAMAGCIVYYVKYVLNNMDLVGVLGVVTLVSMAAGIALAPLASKKVSAKKLMLAGLAIKAVTLAVNFAIPRSLPLFFGLSALRSFTGAPMMVYCGVFMLNTIEYGEYKTGIRANSLIMSVSSVSNKIGAGFGGALIGWLLGLGGYDGAAATQGALAQQMIAIIYFLAPLIASAIAFALLHLYKLDKEYDGVAAALKARKLRDAV